MALKQLRRTVRDLVELVNDAITDLDTVFKRLDAYATLANEHDRHFQNLFERLRVAERKLEGQSNVLGMQRADINQAAIDISNLAERVSALEDFNDMRASHQLEAHRPLIAVIGQPEPAFTTPDPFDQTVLDHMPVDLSDQFPNAPIVGEEIPPA
jgi:hypothetical protein